MSDWIEWNGGDMPVRKWAKVDVKFRSGDDTERFPIDEPIHMAAVHLWKHENHPSDVVAYKVLKP